MEGPPLPKPSGEEAAPRASLRLDALPGDSALQSMREYLAGVMRVDLAPLHAQQPLTYRASLRSVEGARWGSSWAAPVRTTRTAALCRDGQDDLILVTSTAPMTIELPGREALRIRPGDAALVSQALPQSLVLEQPGHSWVLRVPHRDMASMVARLGSAPALALRQGTPMLDLLVRFGRLLEAEPLHGGAAQQLAARQLQEMLAVVVGQSPDFAAWAEQHSLAAARMQAVQADIAAHLDSASLSLEWLAARQGISARHLQRLLAAQGTRYQDAVRQARLHAARSMLLAPRNAALSISAIAHACGFSEASALSRAFRQQFGTTPAQARLDAGVAVEAGAGAARRGSRPG